MSLLSKIRGSVPNAITCTSLLLGCVSIVFSFHYAESFGSLKGYQVASLLIGLAAVCDFLDGAAARALKAYSELGKQLDSLSDLVSFGVAPAMMVYQMLLAHVPCGMSMLAFVAFIIPICGELRLARFNIDTRQTTSFCGMPIPAGAIFWIGAVAFSEEIMYVGTWLAVAMIVTVSLLMVADRFKMFSLKFKNFRLSDNWPRFVLIVAAVALVALLGVSGLAVTIMLYIVMSACVGDLSGQ